MEQGWTGVQTYRFDSHSPGEADLVGEYDDYDLPISSYLEHRNFLGITDGGVRVMPTNRRYMLRDLWPDMCEAALPNSPRVFEATRFVVDGSLSYEERHKVKHELVAALLEFGLVNGVRQLIAVCPPRIWRRVFSQAGWEFAPVGKKVIGNELCVAGLLEISIANLERVRKTVGFDEPVLLTHL